MCKEKLKPYEVRTVAGRLKFDELLRGCPAVHDVRAPRSRANAPRAPMKLRPPSPAQVRPAECTPYPETIRNALSASPSKSGQPQHIQKSATFP